MPSSSGRSTTPDSVFSEATTTAFTPARARQLSTPGRTSAGFLPSVQDTPRPLRRKQRNKERVKPTHQPGVTVYPLTFPDYHDVYTYSSDVSIITEMLDREARRIHAMPSALFEDINKNAAQLDEAAQRRIACLTNKWNDYRETGEMKFQFTGFVDDGIDQFARALEESTRQYLDYLKRAAGGNRRYLTSADDRSPPAPVKPFTPAQQEMYWTVIQWKTSLPLHMQEYEVWRREYETVKAEERRGRTAWGNKKRTTTASTTVSKIQQQETPNSAGPSHRMKRKRTLDRTATLDSVHSAPPMTANEVADPAASTSEVTVPGHRNLLQSARRYGSAPVGLDASPSVNHDGASRPVKKRRRAAVGLRVAVHSSNNMNIEIDSTSTEALNQDMDSVAGNRNLDAGTGVSAYVEKAANEATVTELTIQQVHIDQPLSTTASPLHTPTIVRRTKDLTAVRGTPLSASKKYGSSSGVDARSGSQRLGFTASKSSLTSSCSSNADSMYSKREKSKSKGKGKGKGNNDGVRAAAVGDDDDVFAERQGGVPRSVMNDDVLVTRSSGHDGLLESEPAATPAASSNEKDGNVLTPTSSGMAKTHGATNSGLTTTTIASTEDQQFNEEYWAKRAEQKRQLLARKKSESSARAAAVDHDNDLLNDNNGTASDGPRSEIQNAMESEERASGMLDGETALGGGSVDGMFEFAPPSFPKDLFTSTPKTTTLERLSQTDNDEDTPDIPQVSSSAGRPVWESESYPTVQPRRGKSSGKGKALANDLDNGEGRRLPSNGSNAAMAVNSYRTVSASSLTGVMDDLAGGGGYSHYNSRTSPPGARTRIGDVFDDEDGNDGELRDGGRAGWNVASSPPGDDFRSSGLRATQRIQRMGEGVMRETIDLLGQELLD
ncbi:hypothetical protein QFC21_000760 [Naganishia friedmannii]|uniref:Uncharacterized protein n=1 Tax=Naganishia friedmannii TaxID=89922 RepID=A0ACC2W894_9TREE|nr:hypothetical protein QFC21_000760 [Naganishia friedmannii]